MKIIGVDNLNRESIADFLWLDSIDQKDIELATRVCNKLNEKLGDSAGTFYRLVDDNYRLSRGMKDLI